MKKLLIAFLLAAFTALPVGKLTAQTTCKGKGVALETIGSLSGLLIYDVYLGIGAVGDGFENNVYESGYVADLMDEQQNSLHYIDSCMGALQESGFITDTSDASYLKRLRVAIGYLSSEAYYLKRYTNGRSSEDADNFQYYRKKAWAEISFLLGFEDSGE